MTAKKRQQALLLLAISVFGIFAADQMIITPLSKFWKKRAEQITELRKSIKEGTQLLEYAPGQNRRWQEMVKQSLPPQMPVAETQLFNAVNNWGQSSELNITSLKPRWINDEDDCQKLELRLSAAGDLEKIARFIYMLETDELPSKIEEMEMTARDEKGRQLDLTMRFTGLVIGGDKQ